MKPRLSSRLLLIVLLLLPGSQAMADGRWRDLPPDDRREMRQQMRDYWQQDRRRDYDSAAPQPGWRDISQEERRRMRDDMRDQRDRRDRRRKHDD